MTSAPPTTVGISIPVPSPHGEFLQARRAEFGDRSAWQTPAHITLLPPTGVEAGTYAALLRHCATVAAGQPAFEVVLRGTGTFRPLSDVVFIQVARGGSDCESLEMALRAGPVMRSRTFYYHPHVTVAHNVDEAQLDRAFDELANFSVSFRATGFQLYELGRDGTWRPEHDFTLSGSTRTADVVRPGDEPQRDATLRDDPRRDDPRRDDPRRDDPRRGATVRDGPMIDTR